MSSHNEFFLHLFSFLIGHIARYAPSSEEENILKITQKLMQLIFYTSLKFYQIYVHTGARAGTRLKTVQLWRQRKILMKSRLESM